MLLKSVTNVRSAPTCEQPFGDIIKAVGKYLAAVGSLWIVAELPLKQCGPPGPNGAHNGSTAKLKRIAAVLKATFGDKAWEFCFSYLERLRYTAHKFPPPTRVGGVGLNVHWAAGDPETLELARKEAERLKVKLTVEFVRKFVARRDGKERPEWVTGKDELRRLAVETAGHAEWLLKFIRDHRPDLIAADVEELLTDDLPDIRGSLDRTNSTVDAIERLLSEEAAA